MRCVVVADLHYSLPQFDWLVDVAGDTELLIIAGDQLDVGSLVDFRAQSLVVRKYLEKLATRTRVLLCSGNHDLDVKDEDGEKVSRWVSAAKDLGIGCDGDSVMIGNTLFTVCPWWDGPLLRDRIRVQLAEAATVQKGRWVWVHHAPPANSPVSWAGNRFLGDTELSQWMAEHRPDFVISGHVHQSPFIRDGSWVDQIDGAWVFNAGHQFGRPPAWIAIDFSEAAAYWFSAAGNQTVRFDEPLQRPVSRLSEPPEWLRSLGRPSDSSLATELRVAG